MNYIKQINAFFDWLETNSMSTSAIALWHALMHMCNKTGWTTEFAVATSILSVKTGLSDRTIRNARNELKQKGRIDWKARSGNKSALYIIIPFPERVSANNADNVSDNKQEIFLPEINADSVSGNASGNVSGTTSGNASALYKQNKTKQNEDDVDNPFAYYKKNIGPLVPDIADLIAQYQKDLPDELITEALKLAVRNNVRSIRYAEKIMLSWIDKGIKSMEDYIRHEREWEHQRNAEVQTSNELQNGQERQYSDEEIEAAARYIKKAVSRYEGDDVLGYIFSLGYPEEVARSAFEVLKERKELVV